MSESGWKRLEVSRNVLNWVEMDRNGYDNDNDDNEYDAGDDAVDEESYEMAL